MKKSTKLLTAFLTAAVLGSLVANSPASASGKAKPVKLPVKVKYVPVFHLPTRPCAEDDDDRNCYWDAAKRGNGKGYSYYVDRAGNVTYLNPKLNDPAKRKAWAKKNKAAGREYWGTYWGHRLCWAKVGDTSYIYCFDGFRETS
ncbi:hypothetical protein AB0E27_31310 [Streptomyces sparsogenes]|uniref:hypothetical protein n=1 Tax=Streptomyces sparsogenes TaxID=67365 RepID=UPI0033E8D1E3